MRTHPSALPTADAAFNQALGQLGAIESRLRALRATPFRDARAIITANAERLDAIARCRAAMSRWFDRVAKRTS